MKNKRFSSLGKSPHWWEHQLGWGEKGARSLGREHSNQSVEGKVERPAQSVGMGAWHSPASDVPLMGQVEAGC